ncbi:MAG: histidine phosphatase family protein [Anaerolineales bacterium]|jgi:phosphohistidine phosphatase|nr:histidine phosphatase family protein [Anaerolineales bacterium]
MKTLFVLRHAKSSWKEASLEDHDRPLNQRGRDEAPQIAAYLLQRGLCPAFVVVSTARRALQTTADVLSGLRYQGLVRSLGALYLAEAEALLAVIAKTPERYPSLMVVGHNPGLENLLTGLTGQAVSMPTSGLAQVELFIQTWRSLAPDQSGSLVASWHPGQPD